MANEDDDKKTVSFKVGRPVQHENVQYGIGTYQVTKEVAEALQRKKAGAPVEQHLAAAKNAPTEGASGSTAEFGGKPENAEQISRDPDANNPLHDPALSRPDAANSTNDPSGINPGGGSGINPGGGSGINPGGGQAHDASTVGRIEDLSGDLPNEFPQFEQLVAANITRYEQLIAAQRDQLTALGIDEAGVQAISTRLYEDAQKPPTQA